MDHLQRVEKWRDRLTPFTAGQVAAIATRESFSADVPREAQEAWAALACEAEALRDGAQPSRVLRSESRQRLP